MVDSAVVGGSQDPTFRSNEMNRASEGASYRFGAFELDAQNGELRRRGLRVRLRGRPVEILTILLERPGELIAREDLRTRLWTSDTFVDFDHGLNSAINKLRDALGDTAENPRFIETVPKRGYRWVGPVERLRETLTGDTAEAAPSSAAAAVPSPRGEPHTGGAEATPTSSGTDAPVRSTRPARSTVPLRPLVLSLLGIAAAIVVAAIIWRSTTLLRNPIDVARNADGHRVMLVVLPFQDLSPSPESDFFSDGMTDEMIGQLGALDPSRLGIIARTTSMQYKGSTKGVMEIGKELSVDYLLEGSVRRDAERVRITARLVDVASQTQLWTETYERDLKDVLMLQRDVSMRLAKSLAGGVLSPLLARQSPTSPQFAAYELVLKGRALRQEATEESARQCVAAFEEAVRIEPTYAPAYAGLGDCYRLLGAPGWEASPPGELLGRARRAIDRALELDPDLPDGYATRAMVRFNLDWDLVGASDDIQRALELNPSHARAHQYVSSVLTAMGKFDEAVAAAERAQHLDPLSVTEGTTLGVRLYYAHRYQDAIQQFNRTIQINPRFPVLSWGLGETFRELGRHTEAVAHLRTAVELSNGSTYQRAWLAHALAAAGQRDEAESIRRDIDRIARERYVSPFLFALMASGFGDRDATLAWLQKTFDARSGWMPFVPVEPQFQWLKDDPEFKQLVARVHP